MKPITYFISYIFPILALVTMQQGGLSLFCVPFFTFGLVPFVELFLRGTSRNLSREEEQTRLKSPIFDWLLYLLVPIQVFVVGMMIHLVSIGQLHGFSLLGAILSVGICCGSFGINTAHELGHRSSRHEQLMSKILLWTSLYMHFFIEHNKGHHAKVATPDDPASSQKNQWLYSFWFRSVVWGWFSAWKIENNRLRKHKFRIFNLKNQMLHFHGIQLMTVIGIWLFASTSYRLSRYDFTRSLSPSLLCRYESSFETRKKTNGAIGSLVFMNEEFFAEVHFQFWIASIV